MAFRTELLAERLCEQAVDLDGDDVRPGLCERPGERPLPRADLEDELARPDRSRIDDPPRVLFRDEEVLAETPLRFVLSPNQHAHSRLTAVSGDQTDEVGPSAQGRRSFSR